MFFLNKKKCVSFFRCESMWTATLLFFVSLLFFIPFIPLPNYISMGLMGTLLGGFFFVSLFVWSEQAYDEREESQQLFMNKWAFIGGGATTILLIIYQSIFHTTGIDPALLAILFVMLAIKLIIKNYYRFKDYGYIKK